MNFIVIGIVILVIYVIITAMIIITVVVIIIIIILWRLEMLIIVCVRHCNQYPFSTMSSPLAPFSFIAVS